MNKKLTRRNFIKAASLLPLCAAGIGLGTGSAFAQNQIKRLGQAKLKISLNAYSFINLLNDYKNDPKTGMSLFDLLDYCAENNFEAIDPTGYFWPNYPGVPSDSFINDFKRRAFLLGIEISGTGIKNDFCDPDESKRNADIELIKNWIKVAAKMDAPVIRVFAGNGLVEGYTWDQTAEWMAKDIKQCADFGKEYGVIVGLQNHAKFIKTADQVIKILEMVDSEWCGLVNDTGCFRSDDPYQDIKRVMPYTVNFQIKEKLLGQNSDVKTDLNKLFKIIKDSGYRGYIPIETLGEKGEEYDPRLRVKEFLKDVKNALQETT